MSGKHDRSYFVNDMGDEPGVPWMVFAKGLSAWAFMQHEKLGRSPTVREASDSWHVTDATVREAASEDYWMSVEGPDDDPTKQTLEHDGD